MCIIKMKDDADGSALESFESVLVQSEDAGKHGRGIFKDR